MKKLMIALVAVAMAAAANAAAVTWKSGAVTLSDGKTLAVAGDATGYLWVVDATTYGNFTSYTTGADLTSAIVSAYAGQIATEGYDVTADSVKKGNKVTLGDPNSYDVGKSAYAIILYKDNTASTDTYMGNIGTYTFDSSADWDVEGMASFIGGGTSGTSTAWVAAPEPTSGLLLLIGMAGLALRRRRA